MCRHYQIKLKRHAPLHTEPVVDDRVDRRVLDDVQVLAELEVRLVVLHERRGVELLCLVERLELDILSLLVTV